MTEEPQRRRRSFDEVLQDSLAQWTKRFERALEEQRQVIGKEAEERTSDIARLTLEQLDALEQVSAQKVAELEQIAVDYREANERVLADKSSQVEQATRQQVDASVKSVESAFDKFAGKRLDELEDTLRGRLEKFRRELIDETNRVRDTNTEQLNETRSLVASEGRQLEEQAVVAQDEMRRVAAKETAAFDELARERISELRDLLSNQTELLAEFARTHETRSKKLEQQAVTAQEEMRRVAAEEAASFTASFDALSGERTSQLQDLLANQSELLAEFTRTHEATSAKFEDARAFTEDTMARLSRLNDEVARHIKENDESAAAAARQLKQASSTELNSIQQRAMALNELAGKLTADIERRAEGLLEAESSTAEGLHEFEQQLEARRAEIETLVEERVGGVTEQVRQAEAAAVRRISELGGRADASLGEQKRQLESTRTAMQNEFREIRRTDGAALQSLDARLTKLVEMIAATQVTLDQLADRVADLEALAAAPVPPYASPSNGPVSEPSPPDTRSLHGPEPDALPSGVSPSDRRPADAPASSAPPPRAPRPDLRDW